MGPVVLDIGLGGLLVVFCPQKGRQRASKFESRASKRRIDICLANTLGREQGATGRGYVESRGQRAESRGQWAESRGQWAEREQGPVRREQVPAGREREQGPAGREREQGPAGIGYVQVNFGNLSVCPRTHGPKNSSDTEWVQENTLGY